MINPDTMLRWQPRLECLEHHTLPVHLYVRLGAEQNRWQFHNDMAIEGLIAIRATIVRIKVQANAHQANACEQGAVECTLVWLIKIHLIFGHFPFSTDIQFNKFQLEDIPSRYQNG